MKATRQQVLEHLGQVPAKDPESVTKTVNNRRDVRRWNVKTERVGRRTGSTPHFKMWQADLKIKSALQRLKTSVLADQTEDDVAAAFAVLSVSGVKTVWDITQMQVSDPAFGKLTIGQVDAVAKYLGQKQVRPGWVTD